MACCWLGTPVAADVAPTTVVSARCDPISAGARTAWSSPAGAARGCGSPSRSTATTGRRQLVDLDAMAVARREREMEEPDRRSPGEDPAAELKRLRRENEILRQERDILKRATAFFPP